MSDAATGTPDRPKRSYLSVGRIGAIAGNTFREAVRHKVFVALAVAGAALLLFSIVLSELAVSGQLRRVLLDFGFFAISLFCVVAAIALGAVLLHKELDRKTIFTLLSKPVPRHEFLLGKYVGMLGVIGLGLVALSLVWFAVLAMQGVPVTVEIVKGLILIAMEATLVTAVAVMFSAMSSAVMTGLLTFGVVVVGRLVYLVGELLADTSDKAFFTENPGSRWFGEGLSAVWPDLSVFNASQQVLLEVEIPVGYLGHAFLYGTSYGLLFLVIGMFAIARRDFV